MSGPIFVCGATGTQGGAVTTNLQKYNIKIHAISRDPSSKASQVLIASGVSLFKGDFDDEDDEPLRTAMTGCTGLFLNLTPTITNIPHELIQAKRLLKVAKEVGITHTIYTSGLVTDPERRKYWDADSFVGKIMLSKLAIEAEVRSAGFKYYTILRPGNFMTNYLAPHVRVMYAGLAEGSFTTAFTRETVIPMVDPNDIGRFGAAAFLDPERFNGKEIEVASQFMTLEDVTAALGKVTGRVFKVNYLSNEEIDATIGTNPFIAGQLMARDMADFVRMDEVRAWGVPLGSFDEFLQRERGRVEETYSI